MTKLIECLKIKKNKQLIVVQIINSDFKNNMQLVSSLKKYGLTENEARIYVALVKLVEAPVYQIALKSEIPRGTTYHTLQGLKEKGLVVKFKKRNTAYFTAESPNILLKILQQKNEIIKEILPDLQNLKEDKDIKPDISLFLGKAGIKRVYNDILETLKQKREKQLFAISQFEIFDLLPKFFPQWLEKRRKLGIFSYLITPDTKQGRDLLEQVTKQGLGEVRLTPKKYTWNGSLNIYSDKIALFSFSAPELSAVIIENKTLNVMFRNFFKFNWEMLSSLKL